MSAGSRAPAQGKPHHRTELITPSRAAALAFGASCLLYLALSMHGHLFHPIRQLSFFDLKVYRGAGRLILDGRRLYDTRVGHSYFTYPPASALLFVALAVIPLAAGEVIASMCSVAALLALLWFALRLEPVASWLRPRPAMTIAFLAAGAALWLEPVSTTLAYGQIDLVLAALVLFDLSRAESARGKGVMIGLAAGLKLTPIIFAAYLLLSGRRSAATKALISFAATVTLGFALLPGDAKRYWSGEFLDSSHIGGVANPSNQSLHGALARILHTVNVGTPWLCIAVIGGIAGMAAAVLAGRRGDEAMGFSLCAITGLLVSPISWTHHWALAMPALLLLAVAAARLRSLVALLAAVTVSAIVASYATWWVTASDPRGLGLGAVGLIAGDSYVLVGIAALTIACWAQRRAFRVRAKGRSFRVRLAEGVPVRE